MFFKFIVSMARGKKDFFVVPLLIVTQRNFDGQRMGKTTKVRLRWSMTDFVLYQFEKALLRRYQSLKINLLS